MAEVRDNRFYRIRTFIIGAILVETTVSESSVVLLVILNPLILPTLSLRHLGLPMEQGALDKGERHACYLGCMKLEGLP